MAIEKRCGKHEKKTKNNLLPKKRKKFTIYSQEIKEETLCLENYLTDSKEFSWLAQFVLLLFFRNACLKPNLRQIAHFE